MIELKELDDLDISERMRERIISKEIWKSQREYLKNLKKNNPKTYEKMRKKKREYLREWRKKHPDYNKIWLKNDYKKNPEKYRIYQRRYWLKKALSRE
ncbi:unnamed protein product [marine sediment metagenome]|uniref:Uncharacterized protein n=1 Tax=marine sediment metagenome TaxID=412755 RepID=X1QAY0_9ZZZZ